MKTLGNARIWIALAVAVTLAVSAGCSEGDPDENASAAGSLVGSAAPALSGDSLTGEGTLDLRSMEGKPTVVVFWFPECPHCQTNVPALQAAWPEVAGQANILTVGMVRDDPNLEVTEGFETPQAFVATTGLSIPTLISEWATESVRWKLEGVPTVFLLDEDQMVRQVMTNPDPSEVVEAVSSM